MHRIITGFCVLVELFSTLSVGHTLRSEAEGKQAWPHVQRRKKFKPCAGVGGHHHLGTKGDQIFQILPIISYFSLLISYISVTYINLDRPFPLVSSLHRILFLRCCAVLFHASCACHFSLFFFSLFFTAKRSER